MANEQKDSPFFLLGAARSGTTMLRLMLNRHPRLAIPPESHFLLPLFEAIPTHRELTPDEKLHAARIIIAHPRFRTWHIAEAELTNHFAVLRPCFLRNLVDHAFRLEIAGSRKSRWGDKTPRYYACWSELSLLFPESQFVHLIRDGRDVSASLEKVGWHGPTEQERAGYWASCVRIAFEAGRELGPQRSMIVRYEDLVLETEVVLRRICAFLGEDFAPSMLDFHEDALRHVSDFDGPVHCKLTRPPNRDDVQRWQAGASPARVLCFESVAGQELECAGYELCFERNLRNQSQPEEKKRIP